MLAISFRPSITEYSANSPSPNKQFSKTAMSEVNLASNQTDRFIHFGADSEFGIRRQNLNRVRDRIQVGHPLTDEHVTRLQTEMLANNGVLRAKAIKITGDALEQGYDVPITLGHLQAIGRDIRGQNTDPQHENNDIPINVAIKALGQIIRAGKLPSTTIPLPILTILGQKAESNDEITRATAIDTISTGIQSGIITQIPQQTKIAIMRACTATDPVTRDVGLHALDNCLYKNLITSPFNSTMPNQLFRPLFRSFFNVLNYTSDNVQSTSIKEVKKILTKASDRGLIRDEALDIIYQKLRDNNVSEDALSGGIHAIGNAYRVGATNRLLPADTSTLMRDLAGSNENTPLRGTVRGAIRAVRDKKKMN
jgi:hypothetical protein